jgi:hypothetical protein
MESKEQIIREPPEIGLLDSLRSLRRAVDNALSNPNAPSPSRPDSQPPLTPSDIRQGLDNLRNDILKFQKAGVGCRKHTP